MGTMSKIMVRLQRLFTKPCITNTHMPLLFQRNRMHRSLCYHSPIDDNTIHEFKKVRKLYTITKRRERWTDEEHLKFLEGLKLHGRAWRRIEEHVGTRTAVQITSHAQKFFSKLVKGSSGRGVPIVESHDIEIPPPRPKRKPRHPYPRKELELISGQPPPAFNSVSHSSGSLTKEEKASPSQLQDFLSHVDAHGKANMVDVTEKPGTKRMAIASCKVLLGEIAFQLLAANQIAKGDVLNVAKIAGIYGAKHTGDLIPLCHNIMLSKVHVGLNLNEEEHAVEIKGEVTSVGQTGVEMEAMTAVSVAGLTVYDMCKAVSKDIQITNIQLEMKMGGKSGNWVRNQ